VVAVNDRTSHHRIGLLLILLTITVTWGWLLPRLSRTGVIRQRIDRTDRLGINPAAIYYTDVFVAPPASPPRGELK
jgi:HAMP domain-containing protein